MIKTIFDPGLVPWSPRWSAWLERYGRPSGRVMWTAVDPWEFSFVLNTGYFFNTIASTCVVICSNDWCFVTEA